MKKRFGFVCMVFLMAAMLSMNVGCKDSPTTPPPPDVTYQVSVNFGVAATYGATLTWDVYTGTTKMGTLSFTGGSGDGLNQKTVTVNYTRPASFTIETIIIKWVLISSTWNASNNAAANFQYWLQVNPISTNMTVDPTTQQRVGPFTGWAIGESKILTFVIQKI